METTFEKRGYLLEDFRLFHLRSDGMDDVDFHYHDFHKLVLILSGGGAYVVEGRRYLLQPGDIVLVGRGCIHRPEIGTGAAYERVIVYVSDAYLQSHTIHNWNPSVLFSECNGHVLRLKTEDFAAMRSEFATLERELGTPSPDAILMSRCHFMCILLSIYRHTIGEGSSVTLPAEPGDSKILAILHYLNDHITEDISIDQLSERFFISKFHMMRRFRQEAGMPIHAYLSDKRLFLARDLIAHGMSATEACYQSGFRSYSSFSRAYQKRFHVTPTGRISLYTGEVKD